MHVTAPFQMGEPSSRMLFSAKGLHRADATLLKKSVALYKFMDSFSLKSIPFSSPQPISPGEHNQERETWRGSFADAARREKTVLQCGSMLTRLLPLSGDRNLKAWGLYCNPRVSGTDQSWKMQSLSSGEGPVWIWQCHSLQHSTRRGVRAHHTNTPHRTPLANSWL